MARWQIGGYVRLRRNMGREHAPGIRARTAARRRRIHRRMARRPTRTAPERCGLPRRRVSRRPLGTQRTGWARAHAYRRKASRSSDRGTATSSPVVRSACRSGACIPAASCTTRKPQSVDPAFLRLARAHRQSRQSRRRIAARPGVSILPTTAARSRQSDPLVWASRRCRDRGSAVSARGD